MCVCRQEISTLTWCQAVPIAIKRAYQWCAQGTKASSTYKSGQDLYNTYCLCTKLQVVSVVQEKYIYK